MIRSKGHLAYMTVPSIYTPTNPSNTTSNASYIFEAFYHQLQNSITCVPPFDMLIVVGDFNAHAGSDNTSWNSVMGAHNIGECNVNVEQLLDFCASNQLLVSDT